MTGASGITSLVASVIIIILGL
ncbi:hypothetical protein A2U01_0105038, partial [Trifolium medium]|nr:hypothetical protein [Trifolium medium]